MLAKAKRRGVQVMFDVPLGKCNFFGDIGPNLENFFILCLQSQDIPKITFNFSNL